MAIAGIVDACNWRQVSGWALDVDHPSHPVMVQIYDFETLIGQVMAGTFREDLLQAGIGTGHCGFEFWFPSDFPCDVEHVISVQVAGTPLRNSPSVIPTMEARPGLFLNRQTISQAFLFGEGVEIGALHNPLWVAEGVQVRYVDRLPVEELRVHYSAQELEHRPLVPVDILDDGETLRTLEAESLNFIICNHMLEHCENPIGTLRAHLSKLKPGGVLYYAVPDHRFTPDCSREVTTFEHLLADEGGDPANSRYGHFLEWARSWNGLSGSAAEARANELLEMGYSIHFHVWDAAAFMDFLLRCRAYLDQAFEVEYFQRHGAENIAILRKPATQAD